MFETAADLQATGEATSQRPGVTVDDGLSNSGALDRLQGNGRNVVPDAGVYALLADWPKRPVFARLGIA